MLIVVALGGNALLRRGEPADAQTQEANIRAAVQSIATLAREHRVVITHGNGPQVGLLALESERDPALTRPFPLDVVGAETDGMIGYWLDRELVNALPRREVVTILTQTLVAADDPAFGHPTKFVGQVYAEAEAETVAAERGWAVAQDGKYWRRVVPSPRPLGFVEIRTIEHLLSSEAVVICAGGGGIPVVRESGVLRGVEAVVDKDLAAALLAIHLDADALLLLTDVPSILLGFGTPAAHPLRAISVDGLHGLELAGGSMGPKAEAACAFVEATGRHAAIGALGDAEALLRGDSGTTVFPSRLETDEEAFNALS